MQFRDTPSFAAAAAAGVLAIGPCAELDPVPPAVMLALVRWRPPHRTRVEVLYSDGSPPDELWLIDVPDGWGVVGFGPGGKPVPPIERLRIDGDIPERMIVATWTDSGGCQRYTTAMSSQYVNLA